MYVDGGVTPVWYVVEIRNKNICVLCLSMFRGILDMDRNPSWDRRVRRRLICLLIDIGVIISTVCYAGPFVWAINLRSIHRATFEPDVGS